MERVCGTAKSAHEVIGVEGTDDEEEDVCSGIFHVHQSPRIKNCLCRDGFLHYNVHYGHCNVPISEIEALDVLSEIRACGDHEAIHDHHA
ncbi:hypothetical protein DAPPUDRAFT_337436 [Daphnia pulex]|uniref:Uncharacterized protein n=1 Tax=Daphnia pulex TaxID=6669 RepID=E9I1M4_DAPPU|nr:hypothetical protein DAPPUDRAFT_337436 [Daphnia pulex]|eukprot:EFX62107.1 hypothetical protein DAPPUDRAFT_337436 [Daphnia pulex]